jgi:hypothetical protein
MSFVCYQSTAFSTNEPLVHKVQIIQHKDSKLTENFVNLRTFEDGRATDNGVCLYKSEFVKLLSFLEKKENTTLKDVRTVKFFKIDGPMFEILLIKPNYEFQVMILSEEEINSLVNMKESILKDCTLN